MQNNFINGKKTAFFVVLFLLLSFIINYFLGIYIDNSKLEYDVYIELETTVSDYISLYYKSPEAGQQQEDGTVKPIFDDNYSQRIYVNAQNRFQKIKFTVPAEGIENLGFKMGSKSNISFKIKEISIDSLTKIKTFDAADIQLTFSALNHIGKINERDNYASLKTIGSNPIMSNEKPIEITKSNGAGFGISIAAAFILTAAVGALIKFIFSKSSKNKKPDLKAVLTVVLIFMIFALPILFSISKILFIACLIITLFCIIFLIISKSKGFNFSIKGRVLNFVFVALMIICFSLPLAATALSPKSYESDIELNLSNIDRYFEKISFKYENNFALQESYDNIYGVLKTHVLSDSLSDRVIIGKNDWLFSVETLNDYKRINSFPASGSVEKEMINNIENYEKVMLNNGIQFYFMVVPNKNTVYSQYMPSNIRRANRTARIDQVYLDFYKYSDIKVVEIKDTLIEAAKNNDFLYYKTDKLLTQTGALEAIKVLENFVSADFPEYIALDKNSLTKIERESVMKSLANLMNRFDEYTELDTIYFENQVKDIEINIGKLGENGEIEENSFTFDSALADDLILRGEEYQINDYIHIKNPNALNDMKILVIRDEFAVNMIPFLNHMFSECIYTTDIKIRTKYIIEQEVDFVLYEISENKLELINKK